MNKNLELHQAIKQKQQQLASLKEQLTDLISRRDHLLFTKKKNLEAMYIIKIGQYEYRLAEAECSTARLKRKIALLQSQINKGKSIDLDDIEKTLDREYRKWEQQIKQLTEQVTRADTRIKSLLPAADSRKLQKLYRKLVKILHPDLNPVMDDKQKLLWQRLQDAYRNGDLEEVELIDMLTASFKETDIQKNQGQLDKAISSYQQKVRKLSDEIVTILSAFPFDIEENLKDQKWVQARVTEYNKKTKQQQQYSHKLKIVVDTLIADHMAIGKQVEG
ncbi:MAG: hypothetical protein U5N58_08630 [Actinomycetota bacterium]|nr:hypothetical protein [Actinomycetota bacterium]